MSWKRLQKCVANVGVEAFSTPAQGGSSECSGQKQCVSVAVAFDAPLELSVADALGSKSASAQKATRIITCSFW